MPAVLIVLLAAAPDTANPFVTQAKALYQKLEFEKCLKRLEQAGRWENTKHQLAEIELYAGLCVLGLGNEREAVERLEMALKLDRGIELPALVSPKVTALVDKVRAKLGPVPEPEPAVAPPPDAPAVVLLEPPPPPPPAIAEPAPRPVRVAAPLTVGAIAAATAIAGGVLGGLAKSSEAGSHGATFESDAVALGGRAQNEALAANVCFGVAGAAALVAIVIYLAQN